MFPSIVFKREFFKPTILDRDSPFFPRRFFQPGAVSCHVQREGMILVFLSSSGRKSISSLGTQAGERAPCVVTLRLASTFPHFTRNVQSLVEQGQKGELTMQPGKSMMESLESSINKVCPSRNTYGAFDRLDGLCWLRRLV